MKKIYLILCRLFVNKVKHAIPFICADTSPPIFLYAPIFSPHFLGDQLLTPFSLYCANQKVFSLKKFPCIAYQNDIWYLCKNDLEAYPSAIRVSVAKG